MRVFGKKTKQSCCQSAYTAEAMKQAQEKKTEDGIKILGSGCAKCQSLEENVRKAVAKLNLTIDIEHIQDFAQIASYGVMSTPALVYHGAVVSYGKVLSPEEIEAILKKG